MATGYRRSINKVTYAPIRPSAADEESGAVGRRMRGLEKVVFTNALHTSQAEIDAVKATLNPGEHEPIIAALNAMREVVARGGASRSGWSTLAATPKQGVAGAGRAIAAYRRSVRTALRAQANQLAADYAAHVRAKLGGGGIITAAPVTAIAAAPSTVLARGVVSMTPPVLPVEDPRLSAASLRTSFGAAMEWARVGNPARADTIGALARQVAGLRIDFSNLAAVDWDGFADVVIDTSEDATDWTDDLTDGFEERMKIEPIGRLHLERIDMTPAGIIRGELVHSVGLAPAETITLIHREWSSREVSFEKVVSEEFEQSKEEGMTENTELASATETQARHSSALSMEATASGSWGFASASATVGYNSTSGDETTKKDSRNHSIQVTRKASSRSRKEHKVTLTVKEQAGVEDQAVRTITNPSDNNAMRIDLHQMIRDWKVDLYRYGLRLTYDIVVPAPGIDLLSNVDELRRIDHRLGLPFTFPLTPADITLDKWQSLASQYGAEVEPPDPATRQLEQQLAYPYRPDDEAEQERYDTLEFDIPEGYYVTGGWFRAFVHLYTGGHYNVVDSGAGPIGHNDDTMRSYETDLNYLKDRTGHVVIVMFSEGVKAGHAKATLDIAQNLDGWRAWQQRAWAAMRKSAQERWQLERQELQERRGQLAEEIGQWDPLTLRRMEREEIMKTTLKWIFGPAFDLMPSEVSRLYGGGDGLATLEPSRLTIQEWAQAMGVGEFIKFLHQAIEWESVLFFIYPYFWDHPRNHSMKRFMHHPDSIHQSFLRGGAARVVLTVRPGFEESFTRLFETGTLDGELGNHPYLTIAQEIRAYAATNYPGIPGTSSNGNDPSPEAVEAAERGQRIASWHEYTPVSALDITINTSLNELK
ncbi:hypothetical protein Rhe02_63710 [Rhizocola hellebori]|uniref:Uncharacterized protein n=1 Tax=Rhizocola hellebori TaxID=1392758 RepID=A0A8J3VIE2_9ACTN|nr:hypothetical protein [Rhizocola hellebori]GIH08304.1 hypothetical protein Rhe02_63710 [Rhizocola hellebori]